MKLSVTLSILSFLGTCLSSTKLLSTQEVAKEAFENELKKVTFDQITDEYERAVKSGEIKKSV